MHGSQQALNSMRHDFTQVAEVLSPCKTVLFIPLPGNNGDFLIELGARKFLKAIGKTMVGSADEADAVVLNGGGGMTSMWGALSFIEKYIRMGAKKIVVLPSSFHVPSEELQNLRLCASDAGCKLFLFAREAVSCSRVAKVFQPGAEVFLGHDMALFLTEKDICDKVGSVKADEPFALIVERRDGEASTDVRAHRSRQTLLHSAIDAGLGSGLLPLSIRMRMRKIKERHLLSGTEFARECSKLFDRVGVTHRKLVTRDVSREDTYTFCEFLKIVMQAEHVITTRLHVAILRHILGLPCFLAPTGGDYRKNESVFDHSLAGSDYVTLLPELSAKIGDACPARPDELLPQFGRG